jgi:hypothetical protein
MPLGDVGFAHFSMMVGRSELAIGLTPGPSAFQKGLGAIYRTKDKHSTHISKSPM